MGKMRTMMHHSRTNAEGKVHGTKHNDRNFDLSLADNIDPEKSKDNIYGHIYQKTNPELTFEEVELKYYKEHFSKQLQQTNENYVKNGHKERCKTMEEFKKTRRYSPEETTYQIGKMEKNLEDPKKLLKIYNDYNKKINEWNDKHGRPFTRLTVALHVDEGVAHIQERRVWSYTDEKGIEKIGQEEALKRARVELPDPEQARGQNNNRKMAFDKMCREIWLETIKEHEIEVETIPLPDGKHNRDKEDMIRDKYQDMIDRTEELERTFETLQTKVEEKTGELEYLDKVYEEAQETISEDPGIAEKIAQLQKEKAMEEEIKRLRKRNKILEAFIELPVIKPLYEQFVEKYIQKNKTKEKER